MTDPLQAAIAAADQQRQRAERAEDNLSRVRDLLKTWKTNRASPLYGTGSPGPMYTAGMASEADSCISGLAAALGEKP